jgi:hypothetical protein
MMGGVDTNSEFSLHMYWDRTKTLDVNGKDKR